MIRSLCLLMLSLSFLLSCKSGPAKENKSINSLTGLYHKGQSSADIISKNGKIDITLCFSDQLNCAEPCFTGLLSSAGNNRFSGWLRPDAGEDTTEKHLVVIRFSKNELEVLFPQRDKFQSGASCDPEGTYKME